MKKHIALLLAAALLLMPGCSKTPAPEAPQGATMTVTLSGSCKAEPLPWGDLSGCMPQACGELLLLTGSNSIGLLDPETGERSMTEETGLDVPFGYVEDKEELAVHGCARTEAGVDVFASYYSVPEQAFTCYLLRYDREMQLLSAEDVTADWGGGKSILSWVRDSKGIEYLSGGDGIYVKTPGGMAQCLQASGTCPNLLLGREDYVLCADSQKQPVRINAEAMALEPVPLEDLPARGEQNADYYGGFGEYDFLCCDVQSLWGCRAAEGEKTLLMNLEDSDVTWFNLVMLLPERRILGYSWDLLSRDSELYLFTPRTQEEADSLRLISFATAVSPDEQTVARIHRWNQQADGYRIVVRSYYDEQNYEGGIDAMNQDLVSGIVPDLLDLREVDYLRLSNKGVFEDLAPYMESDPEFHEEDYLMNVFEAMRFHGRQERIALSFSGRTYAAKSKFLGGQSKFTAAELLSLREQLPEGMALLHDPAGRASLMQGLAYNSMASFVDYEAGTCSFDSPEFIDLLHLIETVPQERTADDVTASQEDRLLMQEIILWSGLRYNAKLPELYFAGEDYSFIGYPEIREGNGGVIALYCPMAVAADSMYKEQIWDFIKFSLRPENSGDLHFFSGIPVTRATYQALAELEMSGWGGEVTIGIGEDNFTLPDLTQAEADRVLTFCEGMTACEIDDRHIRSILWEEAGKYCAGDCTAEAAAKAIQGRVSIYLSEQF